MSDADESVPPTAMAAGSRPEVVVEEYRGKYSSDERMTAVATSLPQYIDSAIEQLRRQLGKPDLTLPPMTISIVDLQFVPMTAPACTYGTETNHRRSAVIRVAAEDLVADAVDAKRTLCHEFVHGLEWSAVGVSLAPMWVREGVACWVHLDRKEDVESFLFDCAVSSGERGTPPVSDLLESESAIQNADPLAASAAGTAVFFGLTETRGREFVRSLVLRLITEVDWRTALEETCHEPLPRVLEEAAAAYATMTKPLSRQAATLSKAVDKIRFGNRVGAESDLAELLRLPSSSPVRPWAERLRWRLQWSFHDTAAARSSTRAFRAAHPHHCLVATAWADELQMLRQDAEWSEVVRVADIILRDFLWHREDVGSRQHVEDARAEAASKLVAHEH